MLKTTVNHMILLMLASILVAQMAFNPILLSGWLVLAIAVRYLLNHWGRNIDKLWVLLWALVGLAILYLEYQTFLGVDAGVATLAIFLFAKALESRSPRDALIVFNFGLFVAASCFLYSQSMAMASVVLLALLFGLMGLYRIQTTAFAANQSTFKQDSRQVGKLLLYSTPFFILLFLFFPRLPPLWHIPIPQPKATTGMSDQMSPGDFAELSQSSELAFRIIGDVASLPPRSQLYWRAMVLDRYDGRTWTSSGFYQSADLNSVRQGIRLNYQYLAADPSVIWVMGLEHSIPLDARYMRRQDGSIVAHRPNLRLEPIQLQWQSGGQIAPQQLSMYMQRTNTQVAEQYDPKAQQLAAQLWQSSAGDPQRYVQNVLNWYKSQGFVYSLTPGLLGQNRIDEFLFQSRQGFCEHYASSFVSLMRYVNVPARVVVGYQGGQWAPDAKSWEVRQLDAHAWAEVWLNGQWQRIDPTAMAAPQRIENGMQQYLDEEQGVRAEQTAWRYQQFQMLKQIRIWSDYAGYQWQSKIVGYDVDRQQNWLKRWGLNPTWGLSLLLIGSIAFTLVGYGCFLYFQQRRRSSAYERALIRFAKKLPLNLQQQNSETTYQWLQRLAEHVSHNEQHYFVALADADRYYRYGVQVEQKDTKQMLVLLKKCANALKAY